ncbi:MAG: GGDEF domain-containing protein [Spirochaetota bacterium]
MVTDMDLPARSSPLTSHQSQTLLRSLATLAMAGHTAILVAVWIVEIRILVFINLFSVAIYASSLILNRRRAYVSVMVIGMLEVILHAWVATAILGWSSGFHIYILTLVPLVYFFDPWRLKQRVFASIVLAFLYVSLAWIANRNFADDPRPFVLYFQYGNLLFGATILSLLSFFYGRAIGKVQQELQIQNVQLDSLARKDVLTGIANRREAQATLELQRLKLVRDGGTFGIALVDLDHFKKINDTLGHDYGDLVLQTAATVLRSTLRGDDLISRWGGEEFLAILPRADLSGVLTVAEKMREALENDVHTSTGMESPVTCTIGVSVCTADSIISQVLKDADDALYRGKEAGRNQVVSGTLAENLRRKHPHGLA